MRLFSLVNSALVSEFTKTFLGCNQLTKHIKYAYYYSYRPFRELQTIINFTPTRYPYLFHGVKI